MYPSEHAFNIMVKMVLATNKVEIDVKWNNKIWNGFSFCHYLFISEFIETSNTIDFTHMFVLVLTDSFAFCLHLALVLRFYQQPPFNFFLCQGCSSKIIFGDKEQCVRMLRASLNRKTIFSWHHFPFQVHFHCSRSNWFSSSIFNNGKNRISSASGDYGALLCC